MAGAPGFRPPGHRGPLFAHRFFGRPYAFVPFGFGFGFGFDGLGYYGTGAYGPGVPIYELPPYPLPGPVYGQGGQAAEPQRPPVEQASYAPPVPGARPPPIPAVITPYEVRPGTMPANDVAGADPLPTVIAGR